MCTVRCVGQQYTLSLQDYSEIQVLGSALGVGGHQQGLQKVAQVGETPRKEKISTQSMRECRQQSLS